MDGFLKDSPFRRRKEDYEKSNPLNDKSGHMIMTYKRKDIDTEFYLKEIPLNSPYDEDRFKYEVETLICMHLDDFPSIKIDGFGCQNKEAFIAAEFVSGGSLKDFLDNVNVSLFDDDVQPFNDTNKMIILYGIAFGLDFLHSKGYVHRDIKPDNILINDDREPFIGDYGFSKQIENDSRMTGAIGTTPYMAPEMLKEEIANTDKSVDVYSFAVTSLHIITGDLQFDGMSIFDIDQSKMHTDSEQFIRAKIIKGIRYDIPESVPDNFKKFIQSCWSDNPSERWTMKEICQALRNDDLFLHNYDKKLFQQYVEKLDNALAQL